MEIEGHPTLDLVAELEQRGAVRIPGTTSGPDPDVVPAIGGADEAPGTWLFLPSVAFMTGLDELPE